MPRQVVVRTKECTEKVGRRLEGGPVHDDPQSAIHTLHTSLATRKGAGCQGKVRKEDWGWCRAAGARKERSVEKEWKEWKKLASGAQRASSDNKRGRWEAKKLPRYYTAEGVAKFGGQRISGRSKCVWLCCAWPGGRSWLAGWLANPQGSCGGKSLAGSVSVAGVVRCCWRFQRMAMPPLASPAFPVDVQLQRPCRVPH